jgi:hypothetical protein
MCYYLIHVCFVSGTFHPPYCDQLPSASRSERNQVETVIIRCDLYSFNLEIRIKMLLQELREDHMRNICLFYLRIWYVKYFRRGVTSPPLIMMWIWTVREPLVMEWSGCVMCGLQFRCLVGIFCAIKNRWVNDNHITCNYLWLCVNRVKLNSLWNIQKLLSSSWWTTSGGTRGKCGKKDSSEAKFNTVRNSFRYFCIAISV